MALLDRAAGEPEGRTVRATIRPDNTVSHALVMQYGLVEVGEQWDDEDGLGARLPGQHRLRPMTDG